MHQHTARFSWPYSPYTHPHPPCSTIPHLAQLHWHLDFASLCLPQLPSQFALARSLCSHFGSCPSTLLSSLHSTDSRCSLPGPDCNCGIPNLIFPSTIHAATLQPHTADLTQAPMGLLHLDSAPTRTILPTTSTLCGVPPSLLAHALLRHLVCEFTLPIHTGHRPHAFPLDPTLNHTRSASS